MFKKMSYDFRESTSEGEQVNNAHYNPISDELEVTVLKSQVAYKYYFKVANNFDHLIEKLKWSDPDASQIRLKTVKIGEYRNYFVGSFFESKSRKCCALYEHRLD